VEVVASLSQGRTAAAQCGLFTHKSVPVIFEPPCIFSTRRKLKIKNNFFIAFKFCSFKIASVFFIQNAQLKAILAAIIYQSTHTIHISFLYYTGYFCRGNARRKADKFAVDSNRQCRLLCSAQFWTIPPRKSPKVLIRCYLLSIRLLLRISISLFQRNAFNENQRLISGAHSFISGT